MIFRSRISLVKVLTVCKCNTIGLKNWIIQKKFPFNILQKKSSTMHKITKNSDQKTSWQKKDKKNSKHFQKNYIPKKSLLQNIAKVNANYQNSNKPKKKNYFPKKKFQKKNSKNPKKAQKHTKTSKNSPKRYKHTFWKNFKQAKTPQKNLTKIFGPKLEYKMQKNIYLFYIIQLKKILVYVKFPPLNTCNQKYHGGTITSKWHDMRFNWF